MIRQNPYRQCQLVPSVWVERSMDFGEQFVAHYTAADAMGDCRRLVEQLGEEVVTQLILDPFRRHLV